MSRKNFLIAWQADGTIAWTLVALRDFGSSQGLIRLDRCFQSVFGVLLIDHKSYALFLIMHSLRKAAKRQTNVQEGEAGGSATKGGI